MLCMILVAIINFFFSTARSFYSSKMPSLLISIPKYGLTIMIYNTSTVHVQENLASDVTYVRNGFNCIYLSRSI